MVEARKLILGDLVLPKPYWMEGLDAQLKAVGDLQEKINAGTTFAVSSELAKQFDAVNRVTAQFQNSLSPVVEASSAATCQPLDPLPQSIAEKQPSPKERVSNSRTGRKAPRPGRP
jgi:hypothetical protein